MFIVICRRDFSLYPGRHKAEIKSFLRAFKKMADESDVENSGDLMEKRSLLSFDNAGMITLCVFLLFIICVLLLGLLKALIGKCYPTVGMWGIGVLIDLPRPIHHYQERDLRCHKVVYDIAGWPIHPITRKRTVKAVSNQTEFCLNIIFFLTFPLILLVRFVSMCLFQTYDTDDDKAVCFTRAQTIQIWKNKRNNKIPLTQCDE